MGNHVHEVEHPDSFSHQLYEFQIGSIVDYRENVNNTFNVPLLNATYMYTFYYMKCRHI